METLTKEQYQQRLTELQSARQNNAAKKAKFQSSKPTLTKPAKITKRNWLQIVADFLTK